MNAALVPIKQLDAAKSRLLAHLEPDAVERLGLAMLEDVVAALAEVPELDRIVVVTPDAAVAAAARQAGAEGMLRKEPGLNPSLDAAGEVLAAEGATTLLVVLGDVAGALPSEVSAMFRALDGMGGRGMVLAPSRDGGTCALLRAPHDAISNHFGKESGTAHRAAAERAGVAYCVLPLPSLAVDLDRFEDAASIARGPGAPRTRKLLLELGLPETG